MRQKIHCLDCGADNSQIKTDKGLECEHCGKSNNFELYCVEGEE